MIERKIKENLDQWRSVYQKAPQGLFHSSAGLRSCSPEVGSRDVEGSRMATLKAVKCRCMIRTKARSKPPCLLSRLCSKWDEDDFAT